LGRIDGSVGLEHSVHKARHLLRGDPDRLGFLLGWINRTEPECGDQERDACGNSRGSEAVHGASFDEEVEEARGKVTIQAVPAPSTLSRRMSPPNFLMMRRATVNPRPERAALSFVVKNGLNIFDRCCFGIPGPESAIVVTTVLPASLVESRSVPFPFMAWTAFIRRLVNACLSWSGSADTRVSPAYCRSTVRSGVPRLVVMVARARSSSHSRCTICR